MYNVICFNYLETDLNEVEPYSMRDFCKEIGYTPRCHQQLYDSLSTIKIIHNDIEDVIFKKITLDNKEYLIINPYLFYAGDNLDKVLKLGNFFNTNDKDKLNKNVSIT
jgi:hypothetical protein